jgi:hypothetical protein
MNINELPKLDELLEHHRMFHDEFQMDYCITGGRHPWHQFVQALRELYGRTRSLRGTITDRDLAIIDIEEMESELADPEISSFDRRRKEIEIRRKRSSLEEADRTIRDQKREFIRFYGQAVALKSTLEEEYGELTEEVKKTLSQDAWYHFFKQRAAVDLMTSGSISPMVINNALGMPHHIRVQLLAEIQDRGALITWAGNQHDTVIPEKKLPFDESVEARELLEYNLDQQTSPLISDLKE